MSKIWGILLLSFGLNSGFCSGAQAQERSWQRIQVPNASCGFGDPYFIFLSLGKSEKLALAFQGGGACWGAESCTGMLKTADLGSQTRMEESGGFFSLNAQKTPVNEASMIFFPYCTGDVFAGSHQATYDGKKVFHVGYQNIESALDLINKQYGHLVEKAKHLTVYGFSAGALGAMVHVPTIDRVFRNTPQKVLLLDAPGLHWGDRFWYKFTAQQIRDYSIAMEEVGLTINMNQGVVAEIVPHLCGLYKDWSVGAMQSTRDRVMSLLFGEISMAEHEKRVLSPTGIYEVTKDSNDHCSAWVPSSTNHSFLSRDKMALPTAGGLSAVQYAYEVDQYKILQSYK